MSSYAKNKLQMCSVTQHQCRRRQMCGKCSQIHPVHSLLQIALEQSSYTGTNLLFRCCVTQIRALIFKIKRTFMMLHPNFERLSLKCIVDNAAQQTI